MSDMSYARLPDKGEKIDLEVNLHEGVVGFKPEFVYYDGIVGNLVEAREAREREELAVKEGEDEYSYDYFLRETYDPNLGRFRSVRMFKVVRGEEVILHEGERWNGRVDDWRISDRKSKDGRAIIYVDVRDLQRRYSWSRERDGDGLVVTLKCGDRALRRRMIPLKERLYRFRAEGDPTKTITEIKALGTEQRPIALVDLHFPRRTTLRELVDAELAVFARGSRVALQKAAAQNILKTIRVVSPEKLRKYQELPFVGRNAELNTVLGRR